MTTDIFTLCLDPSGDESVGAVLVGGGHGGVQLELLRPDGHAPAAGLGILPARGQWDELCPILVQGGDNIYISTVRTVLLYYNHKQYGQHWFPPILGVPCKLEVPTPNMRGRF